MRRILFAAVVAALALPVAAEGCGTPGGRCDTSLGFYRLALPEHADQPVPAVLYLHGWGSSSAAAMDAPMVDAFMGRGYAVIAPEGVPREGRPQRDWGVRDGEEHPRDDLAFLAGVLDDAAARGVDREHVLVAGFSRGGSMVWDLACRVPGLARAYAAIAGAFWHPMPEDCAGPADLLHIHGWTDDVVPLEGRSIAGEDIAQGDVWRSLAVLRKADGCGDDTADATPVEPGASWRRTWACPDGRLDLMLHPGGHRRPAGWTDTVLDWFEALESR